MAPADAALKRDRNDAVDGEGVPSDAQKLRMLDEEDKSSCKRWTSEQDEALRQAVEEFGQRNWKSIAERVPGRNHAQCLQRWNKVLKPGLVKGHWSFEEDSILERMVLQGCHSWGELSNNIPGRTAKQCRERWRNHLDPSINKSPFSYEEDVTVQQGYEQYGNRWTQIAELLPGRTEDAVKLRWKALNPTQKTNAKPGRPKLMPGSSSTTVLKSRTPLTNPDSMIATPMTPPPPPTSMSHVSTLQQQLAKQPPMYNYSPRTAVYHDPSLVMASPMDCLQQQQTQQQQQQYPLNVVRLGTNQVEEPSVEPLGRHERREDVNAKDAAYLHELLRSQSNSLLSIGSARGGLHSFTDLSPDELLASGELDALFRAVSLVNGTNQQEDTSQSSVHSFGSLESGINLQEALASMGSEDKHIFQELLDDLRANGRVSDADLCRLSSSSIRNSLEFERKTPVPEKNQLIGDEADLEDILESDLMKPIRKGKRI